MSEDNVIGFPGGALSRVVWHCGCGCQSFHLRGDQALVCALCGRPVEAAKAGQWRRLQAPAPGGIAAAAAAPVSTNVIDLGASVANLRRTADIALRAPEDMAGLIVIENAGAVHAWGAPCVSGDDRDWLARRLGDAFRLLSAPASDGGAS